MIDRFTGKYACLSNFYPCEIWYEGRQYPSLEHAYQAAKTTVEHEIEAIRTAPTPGKAKRLGQKCTIRPNWEQLKLAVMYKLVKYKFSHPVLTTLLLSTGDQKLAEGNDWGDTFWGQIEEDGWNGQLKTVGSNWLGYILMLVRAELHLGI